MDERPVFRIDPMNEVEVDTGASLMSIVKSKETSDDQNNWFIQVFHIKCSTVFMVFFYSVRLPSESTHCPNWVGTLLTNEKRPFNPVHHLSGLNRQHLESGPFFFSIYAEADPCLLLPRVLRHRPRQLGTQPVPGERWRRRNGLRIRPKQEEIAQPHQVQRGSGLSAVDAN
jgi:hypothetical protein